MVKIWVLFFSLFRFEMKKEIWQMDFSHFWKKAMFLLKLFGMGIGI